MKLRNFLNRYKEYIRDFGLNIIASAIVTVVTSLLVNPIMATRYSGDVYGTILTLCGVVSVLSSALGNTLNNVKLLYKNEEKENYNFIISFAGVIAALIMLVMSIFMYHADVFLSVMLGIHAFFLTVNLYYSVTYRININYVQNLRYSIIVAFGYVAGLIISCFWDAWPIIYLCADVAGFICLYKSSTLFRDSYCITVKINKVLKKYFPLITTSLLGQVLLYLDRFIIYPLVGGDAVATYSVASFFGKSMGLVMAPIAVVLLSYYADDGKGLGRNIFWKLNATVIGIAGLFVLASVLFGPLITKLIYPTLYLDAKEYLFVSNLAAIINVVGTMTNPYLLKYCEAKWQIYITAIYGVVYIVVGYVFIKLGGLWGFAIASVVANTVRVLVMYIVGHCSNINNRHNLEEK